MRIDRALVERTRDALREVAAARSTITYEQLVEQLALDEADGTDLASLLRTVSSVEESEGRGLLTAVVVRAVGGIPSGGFFSLAAERGRDVSDRRAAWEAELAKVYAAAAG